jgi:hypothetical protein
MAIEKKKNLSAALELVLLVKMEIYWSIIATN